MKNILLKIKLIILNHKLISLIGFVVLLGVSYFVFLEDNNKTTNYIIGKVEKGDIIKTVSGTGQVEASTSIDINPKVSGEIVGVRVKVGQEVKRGDLIALVDSTDAKIALMNAEISLEKLKKPNTLTVMQKENSLNKSYGDSWNHLTSFYMDMDQILTGLDNLHNGYIGQENKVRLGRIGKEKINISENAYWQSKENFEDAFDLYKTLSISSSRDEILKLLNITLETSQKISNSIKLTQDSFDYTFKYLEEEDTTEVSGIKSDIASWNEDVNSYVDKISNDIDSIKENNQSLSEAMHVSDELDIRQAELNLLTRQNAYNDYFIKSPIDGVVASLNVDIGQSVDGSIGKIITKQKIVTIPLNEVDIVNIKLNQKANLTFDAVEDLVIEGEVVEIDQSGEVNSGVVTYNVKLSFNSNDERIKPGMSVSASIITDSKLGVLLVPNGSIKNKNKQSFVEVLKENVSKKVNIVAGLSDDTNTEIISGLNEGDEIIIKTASNNSNNSTKTPSILNSMTPSSGSKNSGMRAGVMIPH